MDGQDLLERIRSSPGNLQCAGRAILHTDSATSAILLNFRQPLAIVSNHVLHRAMVETLSASLLTLLAIRVQARFGIYFRHSESGKHTFIQGRKRILRAGLYAGIILAKMAGYVIRIKYWSMHIRKNKHSAVGAGHYTIAAGSACFQKLFWRQCSRWPGQPCVSGTSGLGV